MAYRRPSTYSYPPTFKELKDAENYSKRLYSELLENDSRGEEITARATDKDLKALIVRPEWYGAKGDGVTDDTAAINSAIAAANAAGGGTVLIPPDTTYLLGTVDAYRKLLCLKSNANIVGCGYTSVLKVKSGLEQAGGFLALSNIDAADAEDSTAVDDIVLSNFRIDCNSAGNQLTVGPPPYTVAVSVYVGDNITVDGLWIDDNPGQQCICLGSNVAVPVVSNVRVTNNRITNVANNVFQNDHSAIYTLVDGGVITGNTIINPAANTRGTVIATGLEIHGRNVAVYGNVVDNLRKGANIAATVSSSYCNRFTDNIFNNVNYGFQLWQINPYTLTSTLISNNVMRLKPNNTSATDDSYIGIVSALLGGAGYSGITILGNTIETVAASTDGQSNRGIALLNPLNNFIISNNTFINIGYEAISLVDTIANGIISGNNVVSSCVVDNAAGGIWRNSIIYIGVTDGDDISIINNTLCGTANTRYGICLNYEGTNLIVENNYIQQASVRKEFISLAYTITGIRTSFTETETITIPTIPNGAYWESEAITMAWALLGSQIQVSPQPIGAAYLGTHWFRATVAEENKVKLRVENKSGFQSALGISNWNFRVFVDTIGEAAVGSWVGAGETGNSQDVSSTGGPTFDHLHVTADVAAATFSVGANQVLGAQAAAVADATDAATTMARLNDLLAILRTHGTIDT